MRLTTLYRISDKGNVKHKLPHATKLHCLENYISVFGRENLILFADNCERQTVLDIKKLGIEPVEIALGNAGSWLHVADYAMAQYADQDVVYFLEDDYLHLPGARDVLLEGVNIADYVTLYDHPDKYMNHSEGGPNPHIEYGGEESRVMLTKSAHWKTTNSTTMTFAVKIQTLKEDYPIWRKYVTSFPNDFFAFSALQKRPLNFKGKLSILFGIGQPIRCRTLISPVPGWSTHVEEKWLAPLVDWQKV